MCETTVFVEQNGERQILMKDEFGRHDDFEDKRID